MPGSRAGIRAASPNFHAMKIKPLFLIMAIVALLAVSGCGGDDETTGDDSAETTEQVSEATGETSGSSDVTPEVTGELGEKPEIAIPEGDPPTELVTEDIEKGKGRAAKTGDTVSMQYVGKNWSNGQEFDASWNRGEPFEFKLGDGMVIAGWDEGIVGMKEGGRRLLVIPPDKGYGANGQPPTIPANETLLFVVDLEEIK